MSSDWEYIGGNFNILEGISIYWREFQYIGKNFNILEGISIYWKEFQYIGGDFNILERISKYQVKTVNSARTEAACAMF